MQNIAVKEREESEYELHEVLVQLTTVFTRDFFKGEVFRITPKKYLKEMVFSF